MTRSNRHAIAAVRSFALNGRVSRPGEHRSFRCWMWHDPFGLFGNLKKQFITEAETLQCWMGSTLR